MIIKKGQEYEIKQNLLKSFTQALTRLGILDWLHSATFSLETDNCKSKVPKRNITEND